MENILIQIIQVIVALGIFNVWFVRARHATSWRGGSAKNMKQEFAVYGFSPAFMYAIGFFKVLMAIVLIIGLWEPALTSPAAGILALFMLGAVSMHIKAKDSVHKSLPALTMLVLSLIVMVAA